MVLVSTTAGRLAKGAIVVALAGGAYAFTAANVIPASRSGDGTGSVGGYTASNIQYKLDAANPQNIGAVSLDLNVAPAAGSTMKAQLAAGGAWYSCTNAGTAVNCPTTSPQATAAGASLLSVVIAD